MKHYPLFVLLSLLIVMVTSCADENFLVTTEIEEDSEPVVIEKQESFLNVRQGTKSLRQGTGFAAREIDDFADFVLVSVDSVNCVGQGLSTQVSEYAIAFFKTGTETENFVLVSSVIASELGGQKLPSFSNMGQFDECGSDRPILTITEYSDTLVAGNLEGEFWTPLLNSDTLGICDQYVSTGIIRLDFNVPMTTCN